MNDLVKGIIVGLSVFFIILILNVVDRLNTPLVGDWNLIMNNFINAMPYILLIFFGFFYLALARRGR